MAPVRCSGFPAPASTAWTTRPERSLSTSTRPRSRGSATTTCTVACCTAPRACLTSPLHPAPPSTRPCTCLVTPAWPARIGPSRPRSALVGAEQGEADPVHVDDSDDAGVADNRQVPEAAGYQELGRLADARIDSDNGRVRGHHVGDPHVLGVLAVRDDVRDVGVGDDPY